MVVLGFFGSLWFASSATETVTLGAADSVLIISDAGPVRVRAIESFDGTEEGEAPASDGVLVRIEQSWLISQPLVESLSDGDGAVVRVSCPGRFPCRASVEVFVPPGRELSVVAAEDVVQVDAFRGELSIFAGDGGVSMGAVAGSVNVATTGPVVGSTLGPAALTVNVVDRAVDLTYLDAPTLLAVEAEAANVAVRLPPSESYDIAVDAGEIELQLASDPSSERRIAIMTDGVASVGPTVELDG